MSLTHREAYHSRHRVLLQLSLFVILCCRLLFCLQQRVNCYIQYFRNLIERPCWAFVHWCLATAYIWYRCLRNSTFFAQLIPAHFCFTKQIINNHASSTPSLLYYIGTPKYSQGLFLFLFLLFLFSFCTNTVRNISVSAALFCSRMDGLTWRSAE